jgi:hypothetical protein
VVRRLALGQGSELVHHRRRQRHDPACGGGLEVRYLQADARDADDLTLDAELGPVEVHVPDLKSADLAGAESAVRHHEDLAPISMRDRGVGETLYFLGRERANLPPASSRLSEVGAVHRVVVAESLTNGPAERRRQKLLDVPERTRAGLEASPPGRQAGGLDLAHVGATELCSFDVSSEDAKLKGAGRVAQVAARPNPGLDPRLEPELDLGRLR